MNEGRYSQLSKINPVKAEELLDLNLRDAQKRYENYMARVNDPKYQDK